MTQSNLSTKLRFLLLVLLVFILIFAPYSTFLLQAMRHGLELIHHPVSNFMVKATTGWKEILLVIMGLIFLVIWLIDRRFPFKISRLDLILFSISALGTIWGFLLIRKVSVVVFGFRYDFSVFYYYFLARAVLLDRNKLIQLFKILILFSVPIFIFGILQTFVLPLNFMTKFGYYWSNQTVTGNPLPPYHLISKYVRAMSTFPGPNSLAMYAVFIIFMILVLAHQYWKKYKVAILFLLLLSLLSLLITFSRGHIVDLVVAAVMYLIFRYFPVKWRAWRGLGSASIVWLMIVLAFLGTIYLGRVKYINSNSTITNLLLHDQSSQIHGSLLLQAWQNIKQHPLGTGLGTSGLATTNTGGVVFNPESWYAQITQELGFLGFIFALLIIFEVLTTFSKIEPDFGDPQDQKLLYFFLAGFIAIVTSANFLPSWFEVGSIYWWVLFGFFMSDYLTSFPRSAILSLKWFQESASPLVEPNNTTGQFWNNH
jgi:hypothetical protein